MSFLADIMRRLEILEQKVAAFDEAVGIANQNTAKLSKQMDEASRAQYALQIATMLAMLRMAGVKEEKIDNELRSYLHMGKVYAKTFLADTGEEETKNV